MPTLTLSNTQVIELVEQLPGDQKAWLFKHLLSESWPAWMELSSAGQAGARRAAAERGRDWDVMTEEERETFIDDVVHEGRE